MAALQKMGAYLRSLTAFQVEAVTSTEEVLEDGQKVQFAGVIDGLARMPDRLRISVASDRRDRLYVYNGKEFTMLAQRVNFFATVPAPATIGQLADMLDAKYRIGLPLEDLFRWGGPQSKDNAITSAMFVGPSEIGGVTCGHYAFRQEGLDWQVWIQMGDFPLPPKAGADHDDRRGPTPVRRDVHLEPRAVLQRGGAFVPPKGAGRGVLTEVR